MTRRCVWLFQLCDRCFKRRYSTKPVTASAGRSFRSIAVYSYASPFRDVAQLLNVSILRAEQEDTVDAVHFRLRAAHAREMAQNGDDSQLLRMLLEVASELDAEAAAIEALHMRKARSTSARNTAPGSFTPASVTDTRSDGVRITGSPLINTASRSAAVKGG